jgi:hypothetical protein
MKGKAMLNTITIGGKEYSGKFDGGNLDAKIIPSKLELVCMDRFLAADIKAEATVQMPGQRKVNQKTVDDYKRLMLKGLWHLSVIFIVEVIDDEGNHVMRSDSPEQPLCYLINGNHTLNAVIESDSSIQVLMAVFKATKENMHLLFSQIDNHRPRQKTTALEPLTKYFGTKKGKGKLEDKSIVPGKILDAVASAYNWVEISKTPNRISNVPRDVALSFINRNRAFINWMISINRDQDNPFMKDIENSSEKWLWRVPVIAAMFKTWKACEADATKFWSRITNPINSDDAAHKLYQFLKNNPSNKDWGTTPNLRMYKTCIVVWNYWHNNKELTVDFDKFLTLDENSLMKISIDVDAIGKSIEIEKGVNMKNGSIDKKSNAKESGEYEDENHLTV